jgi:hypothetical protein
MHPSIRTSRTLARRTLLALVALTLAGGAAFAQRVEVDFWHGFTLVRLGCTTSGSTPEGRAAASARPHRDGGICES